MYVHLLNIGIIFYLLFSDSVLLSSVSQLLLSSSESAVMRKTSNQCVSLVGIGMGMGMVLSYPHTKGEVGHTLVVMCGPMPQLHPSANS